jgi:hypothetical protein
LQLRFTTMSTTRPSGTMGKVNWGIGRCTRSGARARAQGFA